MTELNRPWLPAVPEAVSRLLGQRTSEDLASERVALLVCAVDGDLGCGQLTATLAVGDADVSWSDFLWEDGNFDPRPVEHVHQPVVFDRAQYETIFAGAAESSSEHPLARAIVAAAADRGVDLPAASEFESVTGLGVRAQVLGRQVLVGRPAFLTEQGIDVQRIAPRVDRLEATGRTVVVVAADGKPLGLIALGDALRSDAAAAIAQMKQAGIVPVLVTGDNDRAARHVAAQLGIEDVRAGVLPEGKAEIVREFQRGGQRVGFVGDGINDAPALMQADVGIAMGGGTDIAVESADVIVVRDELGAVLGT